MSAVWGLIYADDDRNVLCVFGASAFVLCGLSENVTELHCALCDV